MYQGFLILINLIPMLPNSCRGIENGGQGSMNAGIAAVGLSSLSGSWNMQK